MGVGSETERKRGSACILALPHIERAHRRWLHERDTGGGGRGLLSPFRSKGRKDDEKEVKRTLGFVVLRGLPSVTHVPQGQGQYRL